MPSTNQVADTITQNIVPVQGLFNANGDCLGLVGPGGEVFYPPVGSYRDPVNGTIFNSNGIVIWANEEPHSPLPGSKG